MTSNALTKGRNSHIVITHNVFWAIQKTESFVYHWLRAHAMVDVTCFPAFVGPSDIISSILLVS